MSTTMTISLEPRLPTAAPPAPHASHAADAAARAARLESLLGDPHDPANPHGIAALAAADARREPPAATEELLAAAGLGAEFVPVGSGGRLTRADLLAQVLRPVFRRDVALGFGYGITSLFATAAVWAAGDPEQRATAAAPLLAGGRASIVHHEIAHANGILRDEFTADPDPGGYRLSGRKDVIMNAARSGAYAVYARTAPARGPRSHSVFLLDADVLAAARARGHLAHLPRVTTPGMRGGLFSGLEFSDCLLPRHTLVGREGEGVALALRTFQVNRCLIPAVAVAAADTVLHSAVRAVTAGRTAPVARRWHKPLAGVFADLLAADSMATVSLRALSLLPEHVNVLAAAVKYVVPDMLRENLEELAGVLGGHGYAHGDAQYGALDKLVRDLPVAGLGHAGTAACQAVIVPQLRSLASRSWFSVPEPPPGLFRGGARLPDLDYRLLGIAGGDDFLTASLVGAADRLATIRRVGGQMAALSDLADGFVNELRALRADCVALPAERAALAGPGVAVLTDRYALILAAASVLGVWEAQDGTDAFLADPAWAVLALTRIGSRLGIAVPDLPEGCLAQVLDELIRRHRTGRSCDLEGTELTR
ncbi:acyl-CoA dehydrogenase (plasmid) [Streptomyces sp. NBC_00190]|uniref:acyl-CoA dehydrogenase n=1 Tax=unclassified Streptomyces TaxID=2593676 RepID=UPI002E2D6CFE|nr:acyl-CoA dehydrogenase [Streptomyces sp. NBC_00190]WSZ45662.1 acyl-CoA dehydrogenase [Streptomyces sp. NBC_00868]